MVYKYNDHYEWSEYERCVPADDVGAVCREIEEKEGSVTKQNFLDFARPEGAITHPLFEWDDTIAAEKYRLRQSGKCLSALKVKFVMSEEPNKEPVVVRAYMNVNSDQAKGVYKNVVEALSVPVYKESVLTRAKREMITFCEKYKLVEELSEVIDALEECISRLDKDA